MYYDFLNKFYKIIGVKILEPEILKEYERTASVYKNKRTIVRNKYVIAVTHIDSTFANIYEFRNLLNKLSSINVVTPDDIPILYSGTFTGEFSVWCSDTKGNAISIGSIEFISMIITIGNFLLWYDLLLKAKQIDISYSKKVLSYDYILHEIGNILDIVEIDKR